jgi:hypothetical protein
MTTQKNTLNSSRHHAQQEDNASPTEKPLADDKIEEVANNFIKFFNTRAAFFADVFIKKVKEGNRKALAELTRHALPPTQMDLRLEFIKCLSANISDDYTFSMKDGKRYTMKALKLLVPEWSSVAEKALMESDPALADKLMSPAQWNAKSAFEVTFVTAMNELRDIKKTKNASASFEHYSKWVIAPLEKALEHLKAVNPPGNSLIGYGNRISLSQAMVIAAGLPDEFRKLLV